MNFHLTYHENEHPQSISDYELIISRQSVLLSLLSLVNVTLILADGPALEAL